MIFQHTFEKVLLKQKSQTRRIVKTNDDWVEKELRLSDGTIWAVNHYREYDIYDYDSCGKEPEIEYIRTIYEVGKTYAVQPGRGKHSIYYKRTPNGLSIWENIPKDVKNVRRYIPNDYSKAQIRITTIRREDVRNISLADIQAEGFDGYASFMHTWVLMHDKTIVPLLSEARYNLTMNDLVKDRPAHLYNAWVLEFEVIE